ncbi:DedA family protein [Anaerobacillus alkaliphilus]|uniref:DedA family protein n=1 Tax=Anaerobacillus alkaliphilus TaxID=1548597 RepID=A0A4Q0VQ97_9BACI|nr:DedA family protein [Anaerobacillus alkaliphilus]RXI98682.1 DedA family protein [Anaerobacillus alkaliphilus]
MELDVLLTTIKDVGYVGIFLWLWLGMLGVPVPNEAIVTTIGYISTTNLLQSDIVFIVGYLGILASLTTSYFLGRVIGKRIVSFLSMKKGTKKSIRKALHLIKKYHVYSLVISYFIPGVRIFVPFLYGMMRLSYLRFALLSYTTALIWFCLFFSLGRLSGTNEDLSIYVAITAIISISIFSIILNWFKKKKKRLAEQVPGEYS